VLITGAGVVETIRIDRKDERRNFGRVIADFVNKGYTVLAVIPAQLGPFGAMGYEILSVDVVLVRTSEQVDSDA
jgi:hypothetical protein